MNEVKWAFYSYYKPNHIKHKDIFEIVFICSSNIEKLVARNFQNVKVNNKMWEGKYLKACKDKVSQIPC